ncbi:hypothetical protein BH09MYX1_BH09MYX1_40190 [soil metagenome]
MRPFRATFVVPAVLLIACGGSEPATGADASVDTGTQGDAASPDALLTADADAGAGDAYVDAGPLYPPALWSRASDHIGYSVLLGESPPTGLTLTCLQTTVFPRTWVGEGEVGLDLGKGPQASRTTFRFRMGKDGKECSPLTDPHVLRMDALGIGRRLLDVQDAPAGIVLSKADFPNLIQLLNDTNPTFLSAGCTTVARAHAFSTTLRTTIAFDSCPTTGGGVYSSFPPNGAGIQDPAAHKGYTSPTSTPAIAIDAIEPSLTNSDDLFMVGRLTGPTFDFEINDPQLGDVTGSGFFLHAAKRNAPTFDFDWAMVIGGIPQTMPGTIEEPGTGARVRDGVVTLSFEGTLTIGNKTLTAPSNAPATAVLIFKKVSNKYSLAAAFAFGKGPIAKGKFNRPRVLRLSSNTYILADTVWDTLDVNGTVLTAKQAADVALVTFDESGTVLATRMYGGPGDDESYELTSTPSLTSVFWTGHSMSSIDFGNGPLTTTASDGEGWAVELVP